MSESIGEKIRRFREEAKLSLKELSQKVSISSEELEHIEKGRATPPVYVIIKICKALGVRVGTILDGDESPSPIVMDIEEQCQSQPDFKLSVNLDKKPHLTYHLLAKGKSDRNMEPSIIDVEYVPEEDATFAPHEGEEFMYVLNGALVVGYGNDKFRVEAGQSIYYDSAVPHYISSAEKGSTTRILAVTYFPIH